MASPELDLSRPRRLNGGLLVVLALLFIFWQAGKYAADGNSLSHWLLSARSTTAHDMEHPISKLMADAEDKYRTLLSKQSKTLVEAVHEYQRRYKRDPPTGFDEWFGFATQHDVKMIDEYNAVFEDLEPFWSLSGEELRRRVEQVGHLPAIDLVRVEDGNVRVLNTRKLYEDSEVSGSTRAVGFARMLEGIASRLPNIDFPINRKSDGRILIPWEHKSFPNLTVQDTSVGIQKVLGEGYTTNWKEDENLWESWRRVCDPKTQARRLFASIRSGASMPRAITGAGSPSAQLTRDEFTFAATVDDNFDFCDKPWARFQQEHFFSDMRSVPVLYPVFSQAKAPGYADIRIPSHYYHQPSSTYTYGWDHANLVFKEQDDNEIAWDNKTDVVFWRGSVTGVGNTPPGFSSQYQRHRFVRMTSDQSTDNRTVVFPVVQSSQTRYASVSVPVADLNNEVADVAFIRLTGYANYPGGRAALRKYHRFDKPVALAEHWRYKYLADIDGNGHSGRFFAFLASDSVPIKSTIYSEFYSDWIQPWLHYIPLSQSYQELYNIYAFFSGPTHSMMQAANSTAQAADLSMYNVEGDKRLRRIARAGKQWKKTIGRPIDMEVYVYRLALEWARLWSDDREAMSFTLPANDDGVIEGDR